MAALDRSCRSCFYLLRELAVRDIPGGPLLIIFDEYCAEPTYDGGVAALTQAYRTAPPTAIRAAKQAVIDKGLLPPQAYIIGKEGGA